MLTSLKELQGYKIGATDGDLGSIYDFYFDDQSWRLRFVVVDTGNWLSGRRVLISASALGEPDGTDRVIPTHLSTDQVKNSPDVSTERPVSRQSLADMFQHYGWPLDWDISGTTTAAAIPISGADLPASPDFDLHLQSFRSIAGCKIAATDGEAGHVEDFIYDHAERVIRYFVADVKEWRPGGFVVLTTEAVKSVNWPERRVYVDHTSEEIRTSPEYSPLAPLEREHETNIYQHFRRRPYWII